MAEKKLNFLLTIDGYKFQGILGTSTCEYINTYIVAIGAIVGGGTVEDSLRTTADGGAP
ncbi:hypothetical protein ACJX0J_014053, partial [Zea mays]